MSPTPCHPDHTVAAGLSGLSRVSLESSLPYTVLKEKACQICLRSLAGLAASRHQ